MSLCALQTKAITQEALPDRNCCDESVCSSGIIFEAESQTCLFDSVIEPFDRRIESEYATSGRRLEDKQVMGIAIKNLSAHDLEAIAQQLSVAQLSAIAKKKGMILVEGRIV